MSEHVICNACGFTAEIDKFHPTMSPYSDIRCPECKSTDNEHNGEYLRKLSERMRSE